MPLRQGDTMKIFSVIVPVYYNQHSLNTLFTKLSVIEAELNKRSVSLQLIFVDDGSGDNSLDELQKIKQQRPDTTIVKLTRNFGAVSALKSALPLVKGDAFTFLSADLQDPPELILSMVDKWLDGSKYVICTRTARDDPFLSKLYAKLYYKILRTLVAKNYPAQGFDLALMDKEFLPHLLNCGKHINISLFPFWLGYKPTLIEYQRQARQGGKSRWTFLKKLKLFVDSIFGFSFAPIRIISLIGLCVSLLSFGYGTIIIIHALFSSNSVPGFATISALITFLLGLIIIMLGIIGEYIWRIFDETNKHPQAVIDEIY